MKISIVFVNSKSAKKAERVLNSSAKRMERDLATVMVEGECKSAEYFPFSAGETHSSPDGYGLRQESRRASLIIDDQSVGEPYTVYVDGKELDCDNYFCLPLAPFAIGKMLKATKNDFMGAYKVGDQMEVIRHKQNGNFLVKFGKWTLEVHKNDVRDFKVVK